MTPPYCGNWYAHDLKDAEHAIQGADSCGGKVAAIIKAAELCMELLSISSDPQEKKRLRQACSNHLDEAERLKKIPLTPSDEVKPTSCNAAMSPSHILCVLNVPLSSRNLSTAEKIVLLRGSRLHGLVFPEWTTNPTHDDFKLEDGTEKFV